MPERSQENEQILDAVALVVVDIQERLLPVMVDADAFADRVAFAIEAAGIFGLDIIFTEQVPEKLGGTLPRLKKLAPKARVFSKSSFSAFQADGIQDHLRDRNIYHLLICGLETPVCIYQTALQAADLELDTTLLSDCLTSRRPEDDAFVLPSLTRSGCHILPSESVFYSMVADAKNSRFPAYSELVKKYQRLRDGEPPLPAVEKKSRPQRVRKTVEQPVREPSDSPQTTKERSTPKTRGRRQTQTLQKASEKVEPTTDPSDSGVKEPEKAATRKPRRRRRPSRARPNRDGDS